jgi:hypothetical protein
MFSIFLWSGFVHDFNHLFEFRFKGGTSDKETINIRFFNQRFAVGGIG